MRHPFLALLFVMASLTASATTFIPATDSAFAYVGRISWEATPGCATWTYPGIQVHAVFTGTSASMKTNPDCGYFMVEVDDREPRKVKVEKGQTITPLAKGLGDGAHRLTLTYLIEGLYKKPTFYGLHLDDGCRLLEKPVLPERRIEFIGNSITCGYGIEGNGTEKKFPSASRISTKPTPPAPPAPLERNAKCAPAAASASTATMPARYPTRSCPTSTPTLSTPPMVNCGTSRASSPTWCA